MTRFSRGGRPQASRDLKRILDVCLPEQQPVVAAAALQLLEELAVDPHEKGEPRPMAEYPGLRVLQQGPLRMFYWVREPALEDLYAEAIGFSLTGSDQALGK